MNKVLIKKPFYEKVIQSMDSQVVQQSRFHKNSWRYDWSKFPKGEKVHLKNFLIEYEIGNICGTALNKQSRDETLGQYTLNLKKALEFLGKPVTKVTEDEIRNFALKVNRGEVSKGVERRYQLRRLLSLYIKWRMNNSPRSIMITKTLDVKVPYELKDVIVINEEEVDKIYKKCSNAEERYLIAVLFSSGARIQEFMNVRFKDIEFPKTNENFCRLTIRNETSKTKGRTIPLYYKNAFEAIQEFIQERKKGFVKRKKGFVVESEDDLIWVTNYSSSWNMLQRLEKRTGLSTPLTFHLFRHSCADWLRERLSDSQMDYFFGWRFGSSMKVRYGGRNTKMKFKDVTEKVTNTELGEIKIKLEKQNYDLKMRMEQMELNLQKALQWINEKPGKRSVEILKAGDVIEVNKIGDDEIPTLSEGNEIIMYEEFDSK